MQPKARIPNTFPRVDFVQVILPEKMNAINEGIDTRVDPPR